MTLHDRIRLLVADALYLKPDQVGLDASLCADLGASGIDLLDIAHRMKRSFGIDVADRECLRRTGAGLADDGRLTVARLVELVQDETGDFVATRVTQVTETVAALRH